MTLQQLKQQFHNVLNSLYPPEEINSFFFLVIENVLNLKRIDFALNPTTTIGDDQTIKLHKIVKKLKLEIPIQYILGSTEFFGLTFYVNKHVLIPRPETEELVDWIIKSISHSEISNANILDIGTGTGCIPITLAKNILNSNVTAIDVSSEALAVAKENARINKTNVNFIEQDILASKTFHQKFDIIISNPPYVRELEKKEIKDNVLKNEPHLALFVDNENPLLFYNKIAELAKDSLSENGGLFFEINQYLGQETIQLLKEKGYTNIELRKDLNGNDRMIKASL
ncbi:peptide chain release factor N(5)-glutamine methyltransferase [Urechidicola vernalis]|uniref:Release factor glutamine methyltransferase n=1 Tax=Urechidicola vernalis TaxID=3075600 RepID=A0ABU2Y8Y6_9FLAO|nr:peptide chain release factor N(5)-glutamine methyltransferase [Urechidicola sp. P050]MDT0554295.1 peptide chain release factor N(5)-glutamine methyltransferase [Urechidicola sp. P050]